MMKRRAAATAVRPCVRPDPGSPPSSFPQVTCLDRSGRPVLPPLFACEMRARPALAVLAWSGDGSPVWGCTTTSGDQVPPRTLFRNDSLSWYKGYIARKSLCAQEYAGLGCSACSGARRLAIVYGRRIHVGARHVGEDYAGLIAESPVTGSCPRQNCRQRLYAPSWARTDLAGQR